MTCETSEILNASVQWATAHPFELHEAALQSLIRLRPPIQAAPCGPSDVAIKAVYYAAIHQAFRLCCRFGLKPAEERATEAVHEWFCQLRPHAAKGYQVDRPFFPYAYAALKYIIIGMARRDPRVSGLTIVADTADDHPGPAQQAELQELRKLVNQLPEGLRNAVLLRYFDGRSSKEAASQLGISVNAVDLRTHRAVAILKQSIR